MILSKDQPVCEKLLKKLKAVEFLEDKDVINTFRRYAIDKTDEKTLHSVNKLTNTG